jgi:hypothetical protein
MINVELKDAIIDYLSTPRPDHERTIRAIMRSIKHTGLLSTKKEVNNILYNSPDFFNVKRDNDHRIYWHLVDYNATEIENHTDERIYILVDVDNSPDAFYYLTDKISTYEGVFIRGYSGPYYNITKAARYITSDHNTDEPVAFYRSLITMKDAADISLILDLHSILLQHDDVTCFIISSDNIFATTIEELKTRFPNADLFTSRDTSDVREQIFSYL